MESPTTPQDQLLEHLAVLVSGVAAEEIADVREALYPVCYDPETGVLVVSEDN